MNENKIEQWIQEKTKRILKEHDAVMMDTISGSKEALLNRANRARAAMKYKSLADMRPFLKH